MKPIKCSGQCKKYRVTGLYTHDKYAYGYVRCQICDMWFNEKNAHLKDNSPATKDAKWWYCNCCNFRIRIKPRYFKQEKSLHDNKDVDLSFINKRRASMLKDLARAILQQDYEFSTEPWESFLKKTTVEELVSEFADTEILINLAFKINPPNKISLIFKFERLRFMMGYTPSKEDMKRYSKLGLFHYEMEFGSWERFLGMLSYKPSYLNKFDYEESEI